MKNFFRIILVVVIATGFFYSCGDLQRKVEEKADRLMNEAGSLDSLIIREVDEALPFDSLIKEGSEKAKALDSVIDKSISGIDSLVLEKINPTN